MSLNSTFISDCHGTFPNLPGGDLLVDCGDFSFRGRREEVENHLGWLTTQLNAYDQIVFIAGNHELTFESVPKTVMEWMKPYLSSRLVYLQESEVVVSGFKIYGAPHTPSFGGWAFNVDRGKLHQQWDKIPPDTDILITHGPPYGYGDFVFSYNPRTGKQDKEHKGCDELLTALARVKPQVHCFGHFHSGTGQYRGKKKDKIQEVLLINAAQVGEDYQLKNQPQQFTLTNPKGV